MKADDLALQAGHLDGIKTAAILGACELIQVAAMADKAIQGLKKMVGANKTSGETGKA